MNLIKYIILVVFSTGISIQARSQRRIVDSSFNTWWSNINKYNLSKNWYISSELHVRRANGLNNWQQFLFRPALNYTINPDVDLTIGYTYINSYAYGKQPITITTPENNVWEQVTLKHNHGKLSMNHRYRSEHRFIGKTEFNSTAGEPVINGTNYAQRFRYRLTMSYLLSENGKLFSAAFNEVWINLENDMMPSSFNQNWLYGGLGYKFNKQGNIQLGYMNQIIKKGDNLHYENNHTIQFTIVYDFFKLKKATVN